MFIAQTASTQTQRLVRTTLLRAGRRMLASDASTVAASSTASSFTPPPRPAVVRRVGFVRGGLFGFLLGVSATSAAVYVYLLDDYQHSSNSLLSGVDNLQQSTEKLKAYTSKIEVLDKDLKHFTKTHSTKKEFENLRNELLKIIDDVHVSHLELKTQVYDMVSKK
ncbi:hypothetical protein BASA50_006837 [Batrachochytrium salamandrivorans]|uniref:Uncharacterized protein n=1 Tax=Batrachochytrium salamandrivorans TaxID=1357716 RepID=A0ABQ8FBT1_9FUNG|nr:hypothetical protein BASA62_008082 [Batrachochytrium salamandrivorans]KAH6572792.1 hypothetical protein BASA60_006467 [Batrachochytrium salamandrivorans]KAH6594140.1 hypothetical protein BASA50_006837 [Batrachochytrium salamandrivorans]KAH6601698.1 hypothetical protein BASA61_001902 [Batrachochytrium salamandrivorans]KAH9273076.1 hypothetical protein BASA83_004653 [Batrachochytrium salamandrivorans]